MAGLIAYSDLLIVSMRRIYSTLSSKDLTEVPYAEQTAQVEQLNDGVNHVYWTEYGHSYYFYSYCSYINTNKPAEIFEGTVAQARELKNIVGFCDLCGSKAVKEKSLDPK